MILLEQLGVGGFDLAVVAAELAHHVVERAGEQPDFILGRRLGDLVIELSLGNPARAVGEGFDRPEDERW